LVTRRSKCRSQSALAGPIGGQGLRHRNAETIHHPVAELPKPFREAFVLREINDLSYSETTDVVGAPLGTVVFPPKGTFCRHIGR
jgi:DNA-directed RNA polymerase specialized sigma24 family protein